MFRNTINGNIISQYEHAKLAGHFAMYRGNQDFPLPDITVEYLVHAVSLHDYPFGMIDTHGIGEMRESEYQKLHIDTIHNLRMENKFTEILVRMHSKYMIADHPIGNEKKQQHALTIEHAIKQYGFDKKLIDEVYQIISLLDSISFEFCFYYSTENKRIREKRVTFGEHEYTISISTYGNEVTLTHRPFSIPQIQSYIHAYNPKQYPQGEPSVIPVVLKKA